MSDQVEKVYHVYYYLQGGGGLTCEEFITIDEARAFAVAKMKAAERDGIGRSTVYVYRVLEGYRTTEMSTFQREMTTPTTLHWVPAKDR